MSVSPAWSWTRRGLLFTARTRGLRPPRSDFIASLGGFGAQLCAEATPIPALGHARAFSLLRDVQDFLKPSLRLPVSPLYPLQAAMGPSARSSQTGTEVSPRAGRSARQSAVSSVTGLTISHPADDPALSVEGEGGSGRAHRISQKQISRRRRESLDVVVSRVLGQPTEHRERGEQLRAAQVRVTGYGVGRGNPPNTATIATMRRTRRILL